MSARILVCGFLLLTLLTAVQAQDAPKPPAAAEAPLAFQELKLRAGKTENLVEAEALCSRTVQGWEQRTRANPGSLADRLQECQCRNQLAHVYTRSWRFTEARKTVTANLASLKELLAAQPKDAAPRLELAESYRVLAESYGAADLHVEALASHRQALDVLRKLLEEQPNVGDGRKHLIEELLASAGALMQLANYQEAETAYREAVQLARQTAAASPSPEQVEQLAVVLNAYALLVREAGRYFEAAELIREAIGLLKKLETEHPDKPQHWHHLPVFCRNLAQPLGTMKRTAEERATLREAVRIDTKLASLPDGSWKLLAEGNRLRGSLQTGNVQGLLDQGPSVVGQHQKAEELTRAHPSVPAYQYELVRMKVMQSMRSTAERSPDQALKHLREAQELAAKLVAQFPDVPKYRQLEANVWSLLAMSHIVGGSMFEGEAHLQKGMAILEKLAADYPDVPRFRYAVTEVLMHVTLMHRSQGNLAEAKRSFVAAFPVLKKLAEDFPTCPEYRRHHAQSHITLGNLLLAQGGESDAEKPLREGIRLWEKAAADFPTSREFRRAHGDAYGYLGQFLSKTGRRAEAEEAFRQTLHIHHRLATDFPKEPECLAALATDYAWCALLAENQQRFAEALECYSRAVACLEAALRLYPRQRAWLTDLQAAYRQRGFVLSRLGKHAEYENDLQRAKAIEERLDSASLRLSRIRQRIQEGKLPLALQEADDVFQEDDLEASEWHDLAGSYAQLAAAIADAGQKQALASRTVQVLRRAVDAGYTSATPLGQQAEFRALAEREDFKQLAKAGR